MSLLAIAFVLLLGVSLIVALIALPRIRPTKIDEPTPTGHSRRVTPRQP